MAMIQEPGRRYLDRLPPELIFRLAAFLEPNDIISLIKTSPWLAPEAGRGLVASLTFRGNFTLRAAARRGNVELARHALLLGANPDEAGPVLCGKRVGDRPLALFGRFLQCNTSGWESVEIAQLGAHVASMERQTFLSPLHVAILSGHIEVVRLLLDWGANVHGPAGVCPCLFVVAGIIPVACYSYSPLFSAIRTDSLEMVALLVERGASFGVARAKHPSGHPYGVEVLNALQQVAQAGSVELLDFLMYSRPEEASICARVQMGPSMWSTFWCQTALYAVSFCREDEAIPRIVDRLVRLGSPLNGRAEPDSHRLSWSAPLAGALSCRNGVACEALIRAGASLGLLPCTDQRCSGEPVCMSPDDFGFRMFWIWSNGERNKQAWTPPIPGVADIATRDYRQEPFDSEQASLDPYAGFLHLLDFLENNGRQFDTGALLRHCVLKMGPVKRLMLRAGYRAIARAYNERWLGDDVRAVNEALLDWYGEVVDCGPARIDPWNDDGPARAMAMEQQLGRVAALLSTGARPDWQHMMFSLPHPAQLLEGVGSFEFGRMRIPYIPTHPHARAHAAEAMWRLMLVHGLRLQEPVAGCRHPGHLTKAFRVHDWASLRFLLHSADALNISLREATAFKAQLGSAQEGDRPPEEILISVDLLIARLQGMAG